MLGDTINVTYARFKLWQERQSAVSPVAAFTITPTVLTGSIEPRSLLALRRWEGSRLREIGRAIL